ncbi:MAG: head GIN domain-containing protein [Phocaeicola sp.]
MKYFAFILITLLFHTGSLYAQEPSKRDFSSKTFITKKYSIDPFSQVTSNMVGSLRIKLGENYKVEAAGTFENIEMLQITSKEGVLEIAINKEKLTTKKLRNNEITVTVTTPQITRISNQGVSSVTLEKEFVAEKLSIVSKGVGKVRGYHLRVKELEIRSDGVGNLKLAGSSKKLKIQSKGVGSIDAKELKSEETEVYQKGIGSITCYASKEVSINSKGIGSVIYYGKPPKKSISKKGIGSVSGE